MTLLGDVPRLVVSPHYDDAVLSAFALLDRRATVLNVFTGHPQPPARTEWDAGKGFADSDVAMTARALEDDRAFDGVDAARTTVGLLDHQ